VEVEITGRTTFRLKTLEMAAPMIGHVDRIARAVRDFGKHDYQAL
jgi:hypothetical protein